MSVELLNFGCRLNLAEGETLKRHFSGDDDLILVNSCAVTAEAERQARQAIRRAARRRPEARIVVTGCAATALSGLKEVHALVDKPAGPAVSGDGHARAFVEVQNGCDHDCTFCVTTLARGPSRSTAPELVMEAVHEAVGRGHQEVVLTGIDLTDTKPAVGTLVERILREVPALPRLRLSSLDSVEIDPLLADLLTSEPRIMPHVHLSLQHGNDLILKRMKRRHSRADAIRLVERLKAKRDIAVSADLIAGFPTEDGAAFGDSLSLLQSCDLAFAHVFPFSPRPGTAAARMPQLSRTIVRERAKRLREAAAARKTAWLQAMVGTVQHSLIELDGRAGHAPNFAPVALEEPLPPGNMRGTMIDLRIIASDGATLTGVPA